MINEHLIKAKKTSQRLEVIPRIICADNFEISIQASSWHYCQPRANVEEYTAFELAFPSVVPPDYIKPYAESWGEEYIDYTDSVYPYVPIDLVEKMLIEHGGIK